jgi:chromosome segregation ATPase
MPKTPHTTQHLGPDPHVPHSTEAHGQLRKAKSEIERQVGPLRQDLQKAKDGYSKERTARLAVQQELSAAKEKIVLLERSHEDLQRDAKVYALICCLHFCCTLGYSAL